MKVGIVAQRSNRRATALATRLFERLHDGETTVVFDETTAAALSADESRWPDGQTATPTGRGVDEMDGCDLVVSIGGDGTFLFAARGAGSTPILGVNLGEVGFLNAVAPDEAVETVVEEVRRIRETGSARTRTVPRLRATGEDWTLPPALNEIVIQGPQRGHGGGAGFEVRVDGSLYTSGRADGVLVATPTGSTAYNLSEDGPLVHPAVDGLVVTEMAGEEAMPPLVVDDSSEITVRIESGAESVVVSDGRVREAVAPPSQVTVARASESVNIAGPQRDFFAALGKLA
ncbi:NAD(+)/NADH kinase [Halomicrobium sp. IBSBa]|uniref:NAD(+)/NADH kinase n=1 Tax=Halomicrobium sp. IBSBa TaxID=2778916 RepID=UPI001ABF42CD|nr:NAD(+)/NADH kinase [Halomicrobium sp. IBSBa]MBO4249113.1 NAD(+)/NADH kinase [Halomicrobium sp. IBSBa]